MRIVQCPYGVETLLIGAVPKDVRAIGQVTLRELAMRSQKGLTLKQPITCGKAYLS